MNATNPILLIKYEKVAESEQNVRQITLLPLAPVFLISSY